MPATIPLLLLLLLLAGCSDSSTPPPPLCIPIADGLGGTCASSIKCPDEAPICVTPTHEETYGYCSRPCASVADCLTDAGAGACAITVRDVPGLDGSVRACVFLCAGCPATMACRGDLGFCLPPQDAGPPDARLVCPGG